MTNNPQIQQLKTINTNYLAISVGEESGHSLAAASGSSSLMACSQAVDWVAASSEGLTVGLGKAF